MGETLRWSYIFMDWVTIDGGWWQQVLSIEVSWYLIGLRQWLLLVIQRTCDLEDYDHNIPLIEIWHMLIGAKVC